MTTSLPGCLYTSVDAAAYFRRLVANSYSASASDWQTAPVMHVTAVTTAKTPMEMNNSAVMFPFTSPSIFRCRNESGIHSIFFSENLSQH